MADRISLVSNEGLAFETSIQITQLSGFIARIVQDYGNEEIQLIQVNSIYLRKILDYCEHHSFATPEPLCKPIKFEEIEKNVNDPWDSSFIKQFSEEQLLELILVANYLDMKSLLELCNVVIATMFKNKSVEYFKQRYNIQQDLTPQVEEQLKKEYPWALQVEKDDNEFWQ